MAGRPSSAITSRPGSGLRSRAGGSRPSSALEPERRSIPDDALEELEREIAEQLANDSGADMDHDKELGEPSQPRDLAHQIAAGQDGQMRTTYKGRCRYVYEPTYWDRFKDGLVATVKGVWSTRDTADDGVSAKQTVRTTLRELIVYIVFLAVLTVVTFGMSSSTMFYYTKIMTELFLDTQFADTKNTFRGLTSTMDLWRFAEGPLMDGLYWEDWYQDRNVSQNSEQLGYIFFENKLLGVPRIRQVKVKSDSCSVSNDFKDKISKCYGAYKKSSEDKNADSYYTGVSNNTNPFKYHSASDLGGFGYFGKLATYSTGGYVQNLGHTKANSLKKILELKNDHWIDRGTRAVFFDFTVYNANINLFCVVKLIVEFPATGGAIPSHTLHTVKLIRYVTAGDYFVLACETLYLLFIIYYTIEEIIEIKRHRFGYFRNFWNFLDLSLILVSYVAFIFNLYRTFEVNSKLDDLVHQPDDYPDFETLSWWTIQFNGVIAITVFIAWIKVFKYISFNRTMTQLSSTLSRCASDLAGFAVMFFIVFFAFAQLGYLIFGSQVLSFSSISDSIFTLFRVILGDFNFQELRAANRILGPIYFILYVFFVFFVLLNMFLAIINDTYTEVKEEIEHTKGDFSVGDYVLEGYKTVVDKLNVKRGKIADIQRVIQRGNTHMGQMNVDFEACRQDLKQRGYADAEIEAVLAKYDTNGDRVLDEEEQKRMQEDLDNEQAKLDAEMADLEEAENEEKRDENEEKVPYGEFKVLCKRVDSMENAIGNIMGKIDSVLIHLEGMEQSKMQRRQTISSILDSITSDSANDEERKENMERMIQQELEKFEEESVDGPLGESHGPNAAQGLSDVQESKETDSSTKGKKGSLKGKSMSTKVA